MAKAGTSRQIRKSAQRGRGRNSVVGALREMARRKGLTVKVVGRPKSYSWGNQQNMRQQYAIDVMRSKKKRRDNPQHWPGAPKVDQPAGSRLVFERSGVRLKWTAT